MNITKPELLSGIYFLSSFIYTIIAFYSYSLNPRKNINRLFFLTCNSLSIWSLAFSIMITAKSIETASLFNKIAIIGWGFFFSLLLHFFHILSHPDKTISKKFCVFLYLPSIISIILYLIPVYDPSKFYMVYSEWGYVSVDKRILPMLFYNVYGFTFAFLSLINVYKWHKNSIEQKRKKITKVIFYTYIATILIIVYMNFISSNALSYKGVRLISIWILIPIIPTLYLLLKERTMHPKQKEAISELLDRGQMYTLFKISGLLYFVFAYSNFFTNYQMSSVKPRDQIIHFLIIFLVGSLHFIMYDFLKTKHSQYSFITIISIAMIIIISKIYMPISLTTIWSIFFYYIVITTIFEKVRYSYSIGIAMIIIQAFTWYYKQNSVVTINWSHYFGRMLVILFSFIAIFFINKVYRGKIKEVLKKAQMNQVIRDISTKIIDINIVKDKNEVNDVLTSLNIAFNCNKTYLYRFEEDKNNYVLAYCKNCISEGSNPDEIKTFIDFNIISVDNFYNYDNILIKNVNDYDLTDEAIKYFEKSKSNAVYTMPIFKDEKINAILVFEFKYKKSIVQNLEEYSIIITNLGTIAIKRIERETELYKNANYDNITMLKNRNSLSEEIDTSIMKNPNKKSSLLCLDIDNFKEINDDFGHSIGDIVLKNIAEILLKLTKNKYSIARFGADEFLIYIDDAYEKDIIIEKLNIIFKEFEKPIKIDIYEYKVNISIGVSRYPDDGNNYNDLIKNATLALHESKKMGKMNYHFCNKEDKEKTLSKALYTSNLVNSIEKNELKLAFQPQINFSTGKIVGAEALVRWNSEKFGMIPPNVFIPILENTGMIIKIGEWIIEEAVKEQARLIKMGYDKIRISVNLSAVQFQDSMLSEKIENILNKYKINPEFFEFEITESVATDETSSLIKDFNLIKTTGCSIALDDFGVQFSSLNRLQSLPIDRLKIDKTFIDGIGINKKKESIVRIIIDLAKSLGLISIAEGVETLDQVEFLKKLDCDEAQGYYYAKPMFREDFEDFVKNNV